MDDFILALIAALIGTVIIVSGSYTLDCLSSGGCFTAQQLVDSKIAEYDCDKITAKCRVKFLIGEGIYVDK